MIAAGHYIRAMTLIGLVEILDGNRARALDLMQSAGIAVDALDKPDMLIPLRGLLLLMERAAQVMQQPDFGMQWSLSLHPHYHHSGALMLTGYAAETMGEWVYRGLEYWELHSNGFTLDVIIDPEHPQGALRLKMPHNPYPPRQWLEHTLANICLMSRQMSSLDDFSPTLVRFQHAKPDDTTTHEAIFRCPLEFGAAHNELIYPIAEMMRPTTGGMDHFYELLVRMVRYRIGIMPNFDQSVAGVVKQTILSLTGTGNVSAGIVAQSLSISAKTLHRKLQNEDTSFSKVLEECRMDMAEQLLAHSSAPVGAIAGLLDYAGNAQFTAAFKKWKGTTPRAFRTGLTLIESDSAA